MALCNLGMEKSTSVFKHNPTRGFPYVIEIKYHKYKKTLIQKHRTDFSLYTYPYQEKSTYFNREAS